MGLANVPWELNYPMCPGIMTSQCALGMGLSNVPWIANVPWEWD